MRLEQQQPDPGRGWIALAPSRWRSCDRTWTDLAGARLVAASLPPVPPALEVEDEDGLVYVPPVALVHRQARDRLVAALTDDGVTVLVQLLLGEPAPEGAHVVFDLSGPLLAGELERLSLVPAGAWAIWPLVPGLSDDDALIADGCRRLAEAAVRVVQPVAVEITPGFAQRLAAGRPSSVFDALFRGSQPSEQAFAAAASEVGLSVWPARPETGARPRVRANRRLAAVLALAAELWLRLGRSRAAGQALYRAARGVEASALDVTAVVRDGNVAVLDFVDERSAALLEDVVAGVEPKLLRELQAAYVGAS